MTHSSHWGAFTATVDSGRLSVSAHPGDPDPSPLLRNVAVVGTPKARIDRPHVRRGWLEDGPGADPRRGHDEFVPLEWDQAVELLGTELQRVYRDHGPAAVYGGSYGWGSAGRFHHAQSQVHRFLNSLGGYTGSVNTYSLGASRVLLEHVVGSDAPISNPTTWPVLAESTELFVCFGGMPAKNSLVNAGGASRHRVRGYLRQARARGAEFVLISPVKDDLASELDAEWMSLRPGADTAVMLALAFVVYTEGRHDADFLARYSVGFDEFRRYVTGESDGVEKSPQWAEAISNVSSSDIVALARRMSGARTMISVAWSLQRARFGEQPVWAGLTLAAMLGQIGLPGGGFGHGYGAVAGAGIGRVPVTLPRLPQGRNPVSDYIPVARIADMLLHPGESYDYNGQSRRYPSIELVYWCGGNPFHHHQDLGRLRRAFTRPSTVVVHDPFWTATARHADIVLPSTTTLERNDIGGASEDDLLIAMRQVMNPYAQARNDYDIFADLAGAEFTEGRDELGWLRHLYDTWRRESKSTVEFDEFWRVGEIELRAEPARHVLFADFRANPAQHPLPTPSGRIEIYSATIARFAYDDCPGHPAWLEPEDWQSAYPLHLIANNPATRLHSQLDHGALSQQSKVDGREPVRMHPGDASERGLVDREIVRVFNDRGACLAGLITSTDLRPGVVQLATGAWYDPDPTGLCVHGNPNVLTADVGTSRLAQGCTGQHTRVQVEAYRSAAPPVSAFDQPTVHQ